MKRCFVGEFQTVTSVHPYYCNNILFVDMPVVSYQELQKAYLSKAFKYAVTRDCSVIFRLSKPGVFFMGDFRIHKVK